MLSFHFLDLSHMVKHLHIPNQSRRMKQNLQNRSSPLHQGLKQIQVHRKNQVALAQVVHKKG